MEHEDRKLLWVISLACLLGLALVIGTVMLSLLGMVSGRLHMPGARFKHVDGHVVIPTGKTVFCTHDLRVAQLRYFRSTMAEAYAKVGRRDRKWDTAALSYLEDCSRLSAEMPDAKTKESLQHEGKILLAAGCTDPMIIYNCGLSLANDDKNEEARPYITRAVVAFKSCHYPKARIFFAPLRLAKIDCDELATASPTAQHELTREQTAMKSLALQWLAESLRENYFTGNGRRLFFESIDNEISNKLSPREVAAMLRTTPAADPYILNVVEGRAELDAMWRTSGIGKSRQQRQHLISAWQKFIAAWQLHPELPQAPSGMIIVALLSPDGKAGTPYDWFNRAVSAQMDYQQAYDNLLWSLRPVYGGSYNEMYRVGLAGLATGRYDTIAPEAFFKAILRISKADHGSLDYWHRQDTYQHLQTMFNGYMNAPVPPLPRYSYRSRYAAVAFLCGHYDDAQRLLDELGSQADDSPFRVYAHCTLSEARILIKQHRPPDLTRPVPGLHN